MWALALVAVVAAVALVRWRRSGESGFDFLEKRLMRLFVRFWHRWSSDGSAPLPASGPAILIANHPSHADPAFLLAGCDRLLGFLQARECFPVSQEEQEAR